MRNTSFKNEMNKFLLAEWQKDEYKAEIGTKTVFISYGGECVKLCVLNDELKIERPTEFQAEHTEADTLIALHASQEEGDIIVRSSDTDVLVKLIHMIGRDQEEEKPIKYGRIVMDYGAGNNRRYIDLMSIHKNLEKRKVGVSRALPGIHAISGCDYTAALHGKGKVRPLKLLLDSEEDDDFIPALTSLSEGGTHYYSKIEKFVCRLYGIRSTDNANEARKQKLFQLAGIKEKEVIPNNDVLKKLRKINCALLPPCHKVMKNKIMRAQYVSQMWARASSKIPAEGLCPSQYGWLKDEGKWKIQWYHGPALPENILGPGEDEDDDDEDNDDEDDVWSDNEIGDEDC